MPTRERISDLALLTNFNGGRKQTEMAMAGTSYRADVRPKAVADTTIYCSPDGDDVSGTGTSSSPYETPQRVYDMLCREVDFGGRLIKCRCLPGTYPASRVGAANTAGLGYTYDWSSPGTDAVSVLVCSAHWGGGGHLWFQGDDDDPSNVIFDGLMTGSGALWDGCGIISDVAGSHLRVSGIEFRRFTSALYIEGGVQFDLGAANFVGDSGGNSDCVNIQDGAYCSWLAGPVNFSGDLRACISCVFGGRMHCEFHTITIEAGTTFESFLLAATHGTLNFGLNTIGGAGFATATGVPYHVYDGGVILAYGNNAEDKNDEDSLPGNVSGSIGTGGCFNGIYSNGAVVTATADQPWNTGLGPAGAGLSADLFLFFKLPQKTKWWFRFVVFYDTPTAADFRYTVHGPSNADYVRVHHKAMGPGATSESGLKVETAFDFTAVTVTETSGTNGGCVIIEGIVHAGSAPNYSWVEFWWDQATGSASTTTVRAGSFVQYGLVG